jgi:protease I
MRRVAFLAADMFEQVELTEPWAAIEAEGWTAELISLKPGDIQAARHFDKGDRFQVDHTVRDVTADDFDALVIPGGVANPDLLRGEPDAVSFVRAFFDGGKPVAAICHGPWLLVEADVVRDRQVTSWPSLKTDIRNAGGNWRDEEVVVDQGLVTSRKPDDLPAFCAKVVEEIREGIHTQREMSDAAQPA